MNRDAMMTVMDMEMFATKETKLKVNFWMCRELKPGNKESG